MMSNEFNKLISNTNISNNNFSCLHVNIRSLNKNMDKLLQLTASLNLEFSVICVTETWVNDLNNSLLNIPGYNCVMKPRYNRIGGGVALYVRNDLQYSVRNDLFLIDCDDVDFISVRLTVLAIAVSLLVSFIGHLAKMYLYSMMHLLHSLIKLHLRKMERVFLLVILI
jgi:hypothetical protein